MTESTQLIAPGEYRLSDLAERLQVSRSSVERWIPRLSLREVEVIFQGKSVRGVLLDAEAITKIERLLNRAPSVIVHEAPMNNRADSYGVITHPQSDYSSVSMNRRDDSDGQKAENPFLHFDLAERILKLSEQVADAHERLSEMSQKHAETVSELERKKAEIVILNNERANMGTALQRRQDDLKELTFYREECERLRTENETLRKKKSSWWPFGG